MKKLLRALTVATIVAAVTLIAQGCNNNEPAQPPIESTPSITVNAVGWGNLTIEEQTKIMDAAKDHEPGSKIELAPPMTEVISVTYLYDVPSSLEGSDKQALITYKFRDGSREGTNKILVQGHLDGITKLESLPDILNNNNCCFRFGGCIIKYSCPDQTPPAGKECKPCKQPEKEKKAECLPCKKKKTQGKWQADGVAKQAKSDGPDAVRENVEF